MPAWIPGAPVQHGGYPSSSHVQYEPSSSHAQYEPSSSHVHAFVDESFPPPAPAARSSAYIDLAEPEVTEPRAVEVVAGEVIYSDEEETRTMAEVDAEDAPRHPPVEPMKVITMRGLKRERLPAGPARSRPASPREQPKQKPCHVKIYSVGLRSLKLDGVDRSDQHWFFDQVRTELSRFDPKLPYMDFIIGCTKLWDPSSSKCTGKSYVLMQQVVDHEAFHKVFAPAKRLLQQYASPGKTLSICFFCNGGKHRGPASARLARYAFQRDMGLTCAGTVDVSEPHWPGIG